MPTLKYTSNQWHASGGNCISRLKQIKPNNPPWCYAYVSIVADSAHEIMFLHSGSSQRLHGCAWYVLMVPADVRQQVHLLNLGAPSGTAHLPAPSHSDSAVSTVHVHPGLLCCKAQTVIQGPWVAQTPLEKQATPEIPPSSITVRREKKRAIASAHESLSSPN